MFGGDPEHAAGPPRGTWFQDADLIVWSRGAVRRQPASSRRASGGEDADHVTQPSARLKPLTPVSAAPRREIAALIVTHNPDARLYTVLDRVSPQVGAVLVVDNGSSGDALPILADATARVRARVIRNADNLGIAAALNIGCAELARLGFARVLMLDQDSEPMPTMVEDLLRAYEACPWRERVGIIGSATPITAGQRVCRDREWVERTEVITSGSLLDLGVIPAVGRFREDFFIDYVDVEFCLRLRRAGFRIIAPCTPTMLHAVGEPSRRRFLLSTVTPSNHSARRRYYIARNRLSVWRLYGRREPRFLAADALRFVKELVKIVLYEDRKLRKLRGTARGARDAWRGNLGRLVDRRGGSSPSPARILHVARRFAPLLGGTERYVLDLAGEQVRRGHDVSVLTLDRDVTGVQRGRLPARETVNGIRVVRVPGHGNRRFAATFAVPTLAGELRRADLVHLHDLRFLFGTTALAGRFSGLAVVVHTHGLLFHTPWAARLKRSLMRAYFGPALAFGRTRVVADSEPDLAALLRYAPYLSDRSVLIEDAIELRHLLGLPRSPEPGEIITIGRLTHSKGIDLLLRALAGVHGNWRLTVAGAEEREERLALESLVASLQLSDRVTFRGEYAEGELPELLSRAHLAVFPSRAEGFGLALLEALAAGTPVLASEIPAHRSLLGPQLEDRLVDFSDAGAATAALDRELAARPDERSTLLQRQRTRASHFQVTRLADDIEGLYREINPEWGGRQGPTEAPA